MKKATVELTIEELVMVMNAVEILNPDSPKGEGQRKALLLKLGDALMAAK